MHLNETIKTIKQGFIGIENSLKQLSDENFEGNFFYINETIKKNKSLKEALEKEYSADQLKKFNSDLENRIKQINFLFDSIIREKEKERDAVGIKLKNTVNQKKIASYFR